MSKKNPDYGDLKREFAEFIANKLQQRQPRDEEGQGGPGSSSVPIGFG